MPGCAGRRLHQGQRHAHLLGRGPAHLGNCCNPLHPHRLARRRTHRSVGGRRPLQLIPTRTDNDNVYTLTLDPSSLSSDRTQADFVASQAIPQGEYYLASSNAIPGLESDPHTITFLYSDRTDLATGNITVTDATKNTHEGGLKTMALLSDKFTVSEGAASQDISVSLKHYSTLLEFPILLTSNTTGTDVTLNSVTISSSDHVFNSALAACTEEELKSRIFPLYFPMRRFFPWASRTRFTWRL